MLRMLQALVHILGHQKQSADGQTQLDVGDEAGNNLRVKCVAKNLDQENFNIREVLSLHFSFKLRVTITLLSSTRPQQIKATLY